MKERKRGAIDFDETFAPVARLEAIKLLLAYACFMNFKLFQMNVKNIFLNGYIAEEVYVEQPPSFENHAFPNHIFKLNKALYGLKQAGRRWYKTFEKILNQIGFTRAYYDKAVFYKRNREVIIGIIFIHVDDATIIAQSVNDINKIKEDIGKHLEYTDGGEINWLLGIEI